MTAKRKVPKLRFPEFEGEWEENMLEYLFSFKNGLNKEKEYFGRGTPIVNFKDVFNESDLNKDNIKGLVEVTDKEKVNYSANKGDVFFTRTSETIEEIGIAAVLSDDIKDCVFSGFVLRARPKNHTLVNLFKKYCFSVSSVRKEIVTKSSFTTRALTSGTLLNKVVIIYPSSKAEQQKIAAFLTTIDTRIQQLSRKKALLEQYKKGVMQRIFSQEIRFKDEGGKEFPAWEEKRLGALTYKVGIKNKHATNLPIYSINNKEGFLPQSDQFEGIDSHERGYDISLYKVVNANTFAYNPARINVGSIGYSGNLNEVIISSLYVCFKTKDSLDDQFLLSYLNTFEFNKSVLRNSEGGVRSYLFYENFSNIKIPLPSLKEQQKIAAFFSTLDRQINLVGQQLERMQAFKKGLLQQMFV